MEVGDEHRKRKMRILCLHGFRTSGSFLKKQLSKWNPSIFAHFDLVLYYHSSLLFCPIFKPGFFVQCIGFIARIEPIKTRVL